VVGAEWEGGKEFDEITNVCRVVPVHVDPETAQPPGKPRRVRETDVDNDAAVKTTFTRHAKADSYLPPAPIDVWSDDGASLRHNSANSKHEPRYTPFGS
jgi:hypothetical protein